MTYSAYTGPAEVHFYRIYKCFESERGGNTMFNLPYIATVYKKQMCLEEDCEECPKAPSIPNPTPKQSEDKRRVEYTVDEMMATKSSIQSQTSRPSLE